MNIIVAVDKKWGIGKNNGLLFNIPEDMAYFREKTKNKIVIMGKNTFLSIPGGPLKNRTNIVLSSTMPPVEEGLTVVADFDGLRKSLSHLNSQDVYIIGGGQLYKTLLNYCDTCYITKVDADGEAEVFFEDLDAQGNWVCVDEKPCLTGNGYNISFCVYKNSKTEKF